MFFIETHLLSCFTDLMSFKFNIKEWTNFLSTSLLPLVILFWQSVFKRAPQSRATNQLAEARRGAWSQQRYSQMMLKRFSSACNINCSASLAAGSSSSKPLIRVGSWHWFVKFTSCWFPETSRFSTQCRSTYDFFKFELF